jgi:hypothetical protein
MVRVGDGFEVVASAGVGGSIVSIRTNRAFLVERVVTLGTGERARLATDGTLVAVLWSGVRVWQEAPGMESSAGWQLALLDARGASRVATRLWRTATSTFVYGDPLAVAEGHVFVVVPDASLPHVLQLNADGRVERSRTLSWSPEDGGLFVSGGRVLFTDNCSFVEVWPTDRADEDRAPLPDRPAGARACAAFKAAAGGPSGRLLTVEGTLLAADLSRDRRIIDPGGPVAGALWIDREPALLVAGRPAGHASLLWAEVDDEPNETARLPLAIQAR